MNFKSILNNVDLAMILSLLLACQPNTDSEVSDSAANQVSSNNTQELTPFFSRCYHHLSGTLGEHNIIAELKEEYNNDHPEGGILTGYYLYEQHGAPIALYGRFDEDGKIELTEQGTWGGESHKIIGQWDPAGRFEGEWIRGNKQERFKVHLSQQNTPHLELVCYQIQDSIPALPSKAQSPQATFSAQWFKVESSNKTLNAFLNKAIEQQLSAEDIERSSSKSNFMDAQRKAYFEDYKNEISASIQDGIIDTSGLADDLYSLNYALDLSMDVFYNTPEILTIGYTHYSYSGGAHGIYGTEVSSYDLNSYRKITLLDLFKEGYEAAVGEQLANALRIKFELGENAPLSEILYEDAILPNENFGVTNKGVFFVYTPYEIAPYAAGEIELFVSFEALSEFLR